MASDAKVFVDTWSGEADLDAFTAEEEAAIIAVGLESIARHGLVPPNEVQRRIEALRARLRSE